MAQQRPVSQAPAAARTTALGNTRTTAGPVPSISPQATGAQKRPRLTATDFPVAARGLAQLVCLSGVLGLAALVGWRRLIGGDRDEEMELEVCATRKAAAGAREPGVCTCVTTREPRTMSMTRSATI